MRAALCVCVHTRVCMYIDTYLFAVEQDNRLDKVLEDAVIAARKRISCLNISYVCPEPVVVK